RRRRRSRARRSHRARGLAWDARGPWDDRNAWKPPHTARSPFAACGGGGSSRGLARNRQWNSPASGPSVTREVPHAAARFHLSHRRAPLLRSMCRAFSKGAGLLVHESVDEAALLARLLAGDEVAFAILV